MSKATQQTRKRYDNDESMNTLCHLEYDLDSSAEQR